MIQASSRAKSREQQAVHPCVAAALEAIAGVITQPHGTTDYPHQRRSCRKTFAAGGSQDYSLGD